MQHYIYDLSGERVLKGSSEYNATYENGLKTKSSIQFSDYTLYPSPLIVVTPTGYTKHYYNGSERIASLIGHQSVTIYNTGVTAAKGENKDAPSAESQKQAQLNDLKRIVKQAGYSDGVTFKKPSTTDNEILFDQEEQDTTAVPESRIASKSGESTTNPFAKVYYYHSDHLGTTTYITNGLGAPVQFFVNLPFGETMVEHKNTDYESDYLFTGHELDRETNLYYAHARYLNPRLGVWLSVDPLMEEYPFASPYNYTYNNPTRWTDSTGMCVDGDCPKGAVRILINLGGGADINDAANTRADQINKNHPNDKLIYINDTNLGNLKNNIESALNQANAEGYGKTVELSVFGHNGADGPKGGYFSENSLDLSRETGSPTERGQISPENWGNINYNFDSKASIASFYGCNSASWAEKFMELTNVKYTSGIAGKAGGSYTAKGDFSRTLRNFFMPSSGVYLRSQYNGKVLPMYLYTRGSYKGYGDYKSYNEREVYGNPTINVRR